jgi:hypothetical protein
VLSDKGVLVSIDKLSRIPPLDAPLNPSLFGDTSELHKGNVTRKVSMRVSIIDEKTLKEIEKRRRGLRILLTKFTFGLADNIRCRTSTVLAGPRCCARKCPIRLPISRQRTLLLGACGVRSCDPPEIAPTDAAV